MIQLWSFIQIHLSHNIKCYKALQHCIPMNEDINKKVGWASGRRTLRWAHPSYSLKRKRKRDLFGKSDLLTLTISALNSGLIGSLISNSWKFEWSLQLAFLNHLEKHFQQHSASSPEINPAVGGVLCSRFHRGENWVTERLFTPDQQVSKTKNQE